MSLMSLFKACTRPSRLSKRGSIRTVIAESSSSRTITRASSCTIVRICFKSLVVKPILQFYRVEGNLRSRTGVRSKELEDSTLNRSLVGALRTLGDVVDVVDEVGRNSADKLVLGCQASVVVEALLPGVFQSPSGQQVTGYAHHSV